MPDDPEADGAVVVRPCQLRRRPTARLVSFVSVDGRRKKVAEFARILQKSAKKLPKQLRSALAFGAFALPKQVSPSLPKAGVNVATAPRFAHRRLGHK